MAERKQLIRSRKATPAVEETATAGGLYFTSEKENLQFIRTGCTMLDCVLGGGWIIGRMVNLVGDKSTGKTLLAMEAAANFIKQYPEGDVQYKECEWAFDPEYASALGIPMDRITLDQGGLTTIEDLMRDVDILLDAKDGATTPTLYIVDSLDALSDEAEMDREVGKGNYGAAKAKMLSEFFRTRNPRLSKSNVCLLVVSQVRDNLNAGMFGKKHLRSGGKALDFYASQVIWLYNMGMTKRTRSKVERVVGVKVKAKNDKNKVSLPYRECEFAITFGFGVEDIQASRDWLKEVGDKEAPAPEAGDAALRKYVIDKWNSIESGFIPTRRKYGETNAEE